MEWFRAVEVENCDQTKEISRQYDIKVRLKVSISTLLFTYDVS